MRTGSLIALLLMPGPLLGLVAGLISASALAQDEGTLVSLINDYRNEARPCEGRRMPAAGALSPSTALMQVQPAPGAELTAALKEVGYQASRARMISVTGPTRPGDVMSQLQQRYCASLLDPRVSEIGVARDGPRWRVVLAHPLVDPDLGDWRESGRQVLQLTNNARAQARSCGDQRFGPAEPLAWNDQLALAAHAHSRDMAGRNEFSHTGANEGSVGDRATQQGYRWRRIGENIAAGQGSPERVVAGWIASPGHCANLMNAQFTQMGAAHAIDPGSDMVIYWTQVFALPR